MDQEENPTLEDLKKLKEQLAQDLADLQHEEEIVAAEASNSEMQRIKKLQNPSKLTKHSRMLLRVQNRRIADNTPKIDENKLTNYFTILTGVKINNVSLKSLPLTEDPTDKCCYLYEVDANIINLKFNISYCSNQPPNHPSEAKEIIKNLKITLERHNCQKEIQEGLDFFAEKHPDIPTVILFLKSVNRLIDMRQNVCKSLISAYEKFIQVVIMETGQVCIVCKGVARPKNHFIVYWQIKWDSKTYHSARDSFSIDIKFADSELVDSVNPVFQDLCNYEKCSKFKETEKSQLFFTAINLLIEAESREFASDSNVTFTEYSSTG